MKPIKSPGEALTVALGIIDAQERLLAAYRTGLRTPVAAIDRLTRDKPRLEAYIDGGTR